MRHHKLRPTISCEECKSRSNSMLGVLYSHELSEISDTKSCTMYKKGQILFHEGTRPLGIYCINTGKVKVYKIGTDGKEQILRITKAGDMMGYKAMLAEEYYSMSAETLEDCTICFISKQNFLDTLKGSNDLNQRIMREICHEYGLMAEEVTHQAQKSVRERFALTLLKLKDTYGLEGSAEDGPVEINLTREDLANMVGTATETLIRLLNEFKEDGMLETNGRKIRILDAKQLVRTARLV